MVRYIEVIKWNATGKEFEESIMDLGFFHQARCTLYGDYAPPFAVLYKAKDTYHLGGFDRVRLMPELAKWVEEHQMESIQNTEPSEQVRGRH